MIKVNDILLSLVTRRSKRRGRGIGSGKGKTCGRGFNGQGSRTGVALSRMEGGQQSFLRALPKRGQRPLAKKVYSLVSVAKIASLVESGVFSSGEIHISKELMLKCGLIKKNSPVKVLASVGVSLVGLKISSCEYDKISVSAKRAFGLPE
ncbi:50S ribosomal protein L15 [Neorickettsia findlayensis]|uniref:Large ribosomal subunit protein uL15 n=1 Tax=Neorickettsia findlayensis TaxID=2686014 RepID=A0A6P1G9R1_9RICK|nr:50S ribosomal protein L15 [Neorickettsia findlayensis]QHD65062.1 50S ribosomal protein L15 [Neorickettsia findlayensis]